MVFNYDPALPLRFEEYASAEKDGYTVKDVSYASPYGGNVPAYLVVPNGRGPFPAVVFMHPGQGNRQTFLAEAESLASKGVLSLLIDAPFLRREVPTDLSEEQKLAGIVETVVDIQTYIQTVVDLRRGIDLLSSFDHVDVQRMMYVGHSLGATWGGVLAGVEKRVKGYALLAGFSSVSEWHQMSEHPLAALIRHYLPKERFADFISKLAPLDSVHYVKNAAPAALFFQFADHDEFVSKHQAETFFAVASSPKDRRWYETDHLFTKCEAALQDRMEWLLRQLGMEE